MSAAEARAAPLQGPQAPALAPDELGTLFSLFLDHDVVLLAVSGGPDSTALLHLAEDWRRARLAIGLPAPRLLAATVDHGLRAAAAEEARAVSAGCAALGVPHTTLSWEGEKPHHGIQEAARAARYALLLEAARAQGASALAVAHTLDDQAETVLLRLARGSGPSGLAAMRPVSRRGGLALLRPLLGVPKARLVATLKARAISFVDDPTNADPRFARPRLRALAPLLAAEGLDAARLARLAQRMARVDDALEAAVDTVVAALSEAPWSPMEPVRFGRDGFFGLPEEVALRLLGRAVDFKGHEGPAELAKVEALLAGLRAAHGDGAAAFGRTLAGALVAIRKDVVTVTAAPERGKRPSSR